MTYSVEYIVNTGQFEHVLWKVEHDDLVIFEGMLDAITAQLLEKMGRFSALSKGAVSYGYANPGEVDTPEPQASELIKSELGGKVLETRQKDAETVAGPTVQAAAVEPSETPSRPWDRKPASKAEKPWTEPRGLGAVTKKPSQVHAKEADSDDFFD